MVRFLLTIVGGLIAISLGDELRADAEHDKNANSA